MLMHKFNLFGLVFYCLAIFKTECQLRPNSFVIPKNYVRHCENDTPLRRIRIPVRAWYSAKLESSENGTEVIPYAHLEFDLENPENASLDGLAVSFNIGTLLHSPPSIYPINVCHAGLGHIWVQTNDSSVCENTNTTCHNETTPTECLCKLNCSLMQFDDRICKHVGNYYLDRLGYFTVPSNTRYLEFKVTWYRHYGSHILPYYRQWVGDTIGNKVSFVSTVNSCVDSLKAGGVSSYKNATQICCDHGFTSTTARNLTIGSFFPNFNHLRLDMELSWLSPINRTDLKEFIITFLITKGFNISVTNERWVPLSEKELAERADCDDTTEKYAVTVRDVPFGRPMHATVRSIYTTEFTQKYCGDPYVLERCVKEFDAEFPAFDVCDPVYHFCHPLANCSTTAGSEVALNATCTCPFGYEGNGINSTTVDLGTGCVNIDYCVPDLSPCALNARCVDLPGNIVGANCSCVKGYSGNGFRNGTGCQSEAAQVAYALKIAIPLVIVALLVAGGLGWKVMRDKRRKSDFEWSQFVANTALQYTIPTNKDESDICLPTFGEKWEVDRDRIRLGDILGRGNYGIVYKGWYNDGKDFKIEPNEDDQFPVAIKQVKEGQNEEGKSSDFLAEIGFMLNVGDHPNVLGVIGCCTTKKPIFLVTEFLKYGDLLHFLWDAREPTKCHEDAIYHLTEKSLYEMSRQVAQGMTYLTKSRIIHGDLAARNILVGEGLVCKISDFGLANDVYRYGVIKGQLERCVPYKWISPERMMSGKAPITSKSDVWSFGNLMYEMVTLGCMPYPNIQTEELYEKLKGGYRMKRPSTCSHKMYSIVSKCWKWRASARPSFIELESLLDGALSLSEPVEYVNLAHKVDEIDKEDYKNEINPETDDNGMMGRENRVFGTTDELDKSGYVQV